MGAPGTALRWPRGISVVLAAALGTLLGPAARPTQAPDAASLDGDAWPGLQEQIRAYETAHRYDLSGRPGIPRSDWIARNPEHGIRARFGPEDVRIGAAGQPVGEGGGLSALNSSLPSDGTPRA